MTPPRLARWLLDRCLDPSGAEAVGGDLAEEFHARAARLGPAAARRWFWWQTVKSILSRRQGGRRELRRVIGNGDRGTSKAGVMAGFIQDARFSVRMLRRSPGFALSAVLTLAVGIGGSTAILTAASWAWLRPLPYAHPDRLVHVGDTDPDGGVGNVGYETVLDWRARSASFDRLVPIRSWTPTLVGRTGARRLSGLRVGWQFFDMLGVRPALGRLFEEADDAPDQWRVIVISHALWQRQFGSAPDVIGSSVSFNGRPYRVVGVLPASYEPLISEHFYERADVWAPLGYELGGPSSCRSCQHLRGLASLAPGVSVASAVAELATIHTALREQYPEEYGAEPPQVALLRDQISGHIRRPLQILIAGVGFVLLMACANVAGLLMARATDRTHELAVRTALGAHRRRLIRQLVTESLLLAGVATVAGLVAARVGLVVLASRAPAGIPRLDQALSDPTIWLVAAASGTAALLLFGMLPAFETARPDLHTVVRGTRQTTGRRTLRLREGLVILQVAIALTLVIGSGLMTRTVSRLLDVDPGFNPDGVLTASFSLVGARWAEDPAVYAFQEDLLARVQALPGVDAAGITGLLPLAGGYDRRGFTIEGQNYQTPDDVPRAERYSVTPGYFDVMRIPLTRGRLLTAGDMRAADRVLVVSETAARTYWAGTDPIGTRISFGSDAEPWTVVGVVQDVRHYDLTTPPIPQLYVAQSQSTDSFLTVVIRAPGRINGLGEQVRREVGGLAADVPIYDIQRLEDVVVSAIGMRRFLMLLLTAFGAASLLLAAVGLYGIIAHLVRSRERELSIRLSLGANQRELLGLVLKRTALLMGAGIVLGLTASLVSSRVLRAQLHETAATDPATYAAAVLCLLAVGLVAHLVPLQRVMRVDPTMALRAE